MNAIILKRQSAVASAVRLHLADGNLLGTQEMH